MSSSSVLTLSNYNKQTFHKMPNTHIPKQNPDSDQANTNNLKHQKPKMKKNDTEVTSESDEQKGLNDDDELGFFWVEKRIEKIKES